MDSILYIFGAWR